MTAMFVVIFLEQWMKDKNHVPALVGLAASALCLVISGADSFVIPSMIVIFAALTVMRRPLEATGAFGTPPCEKGGTK